MVNFKIKENLKRVKEKIYLKQKVALEILSKEESKNIERLTNEIFIIEQIYDNWHSLYNEDNELFGKR